MFAPVLPYPLLHGQLGIADELLLFCLPIVIAIIILAVTGRRARQKQERIRTRRSDSNEEAGERVNK